MFQTKEQDKTSGKKYLNEIEINNLSDRSSKQW